MLVGACGGYNTFVSKTYQDLTSVACSEFKDEYHFRHGATSGRADRLKVCVDTKIFLLIAKIDGKISRRNVNQVSPDIIRVSYLVSIAF